MFLKMKLFDFSVLNTFHAALLKTWCAILLPFTVIIILVNDNFIRESHRTAGGVNLLFS